MLSQRYRSDHCTKARVQSHGSRRNAAFFRAGCRPGTASIAPSRSWMTASRFANGVANGMAHFGPITSMPLLATATESTAISPGVIRNSLWSLIPPIKARRFPASWRTSVGLPVLVAQWKHAKPVCANIPIRSLVLPQK